MKQPKVAFVLSKFPCDDELFLLREIHGIAKHADVWIFSLRRAGDAIVHDEAHDLLPQTFYVPYLLSTRLWLANLRMLLGRPRRTLSALRRLVRGNWRSLEFLLKNMIFFPKAVYLADWALRRGAEHLHGCWATYPASVALAAAEIAGLPFSFSGHAHDIYVDTTDLAEKISRAAFVTTCTASNGEYLRRLAPDCPAARITVVRHGIEVSRFAPGERSVSPIDVLSVGSLVPRKGFEYLIEALAVLDEEGVDFRATIVGGGRLERALGEQIRRRGLDAKVTMTGALRHSAVMPHFARASIFVLMCQPESHFGLPNVIIEALASRVAVVTPRFGSVEELVEDEKTGLLVPPRDPRALASALSRLAEDSELRQRMAAAGYEAVARAFELNASVAEYVSRFRGSAVRE